MKASANRSPRNVSAAAKVRLRVDTKPGSKLLVYKRRECKALEPRCQERKVEDLGVGGSLSYVVVN